MDVYIYQADIYCSACGKVLCNDIDKQGHNIEPFLKNDSDYYPQGPYTNGGGESDCPQHCGECGEFLENPLTADGEQYVVNAYQEGAIPREWITFYNYLDFD